MALNGAQCTHYNMCPVSPITDQSLAFINAGMNQFKGIFLNYYEPPATKVANSQKCIRVGGKHNDLSVVGTDTHHHTFFEMLGNWSFGDYLKEDACSYAWNLLTNVYNIPKECLYVTYFGGNKELGLEPDLECKDVWLRLGLPEYQILPFGMRDNFWEMGVSGPCGPCTEIHVDYMKRSTNQAARVNKGYADLMELWNIVFIQYERLANGCIVPLPKHHVDTGMGLERLVTLLQGKISNYDTDLFQPLFEAIRKHTNAPEYKRTFGNDDTGKLDYGYRILADHARMITVALTDHVLPEQQPKLRRILRNAMNIEEKIFRKTGIVAELTGRVADSLGVVYPELHSNLKQVQRIIDYEENLFKRLRNTSGKMWKKMVETRPELASITDWMSPGLLDGYKDLQSMLKELRKTNVLPGAVAFKLYDTYGLNPETIAELAQIELLYFDEADFEKELDNRKYQSRIGLDKHSAELTKESLRLLEENYVPKTDDSFKYNYTYDGNDYKFPTLDSKLIGIIINGNTIVCRTSGPYLQMGDDCLVEIESQSRTGAMKHHTAAHLLNAALKQVMQVVYQRGCTVDTDSLKFQFNSFGEQLASKQMRVMEDHINDIIQSRAAVTVKTLNSLELLKQDDVTLIPGEIYPYTGIRIVEIAADNLKAKESCCGTHVHNTGVLQHFCFLTYTSKGATRQTVKAAVGQKALRMRQAGEKIWRNIVELEEKIQSGTFTYQLDAEINRMKRVLDDENPQASLLPYLIKEKCLTRLESLSKAAWLREKEIEKDSVICEITSATDPSSGFIVHCLNKNPAYLSLHEVVSFFSGIPILVLSYNNGFARARCSVPQEMVSNAFNAQIWMDTILQIFDAKQGPIKGFKPTLVASMKSTPISEDSLQTYMEKARMEAMKFASIHCGPLCRME
ncbi:hypothetical protein DMN91_012953 [Ooceraea biroi]|uniref:alanine--tRNA ligase n=1 Tax=Ooceraea biroi TaxID=2015173 RepID=A0A3L8D4A2_OOCBI|nr:hypothetical protein DMN91_012953 [Ooceraea biroi]